MKERTVDVLWEYANIRIPVEVQVHGNPDSIIQRLNAVWQDCHKMIVVGNADDLKRVQEDVDYDKPKRFRDKMVYINENDLSLIADSIVSLGSFRKRIF